ncbi:MAG: hypothetical protein MZV64_04955 [Ignavibacteriales bacterium]|nr:hypothetical protein [Ignavibacteriales bacterium]
MPSGATAAGPGCRRGGLRTRSLPSSSRCSRAWPATRKYEWVETTIISLKGEEKSPQAEPLLLRRRRQGAEGLPRPAASAPRNRLQAAGRPQGRGVKEKVVENKKDEMKEHMEQAAALDPRLRPAEPRADPGRQGRRAASRPNPQAGGAGAPRHPRSTCKPGDSAHDRPGPEGQPAARAWRDSTYLDTKDDAVTLAVQMNALPDGALYAAQTTLEAKAKNITVVIQNSGHQPAAR